MLPYLSAIGFLASSNLVVPARFALLGIYCLVMIVPAVVVIMLVAILGERLLPGLERISNWIQKNSAEAVVWAVGIVGFFVAADAVSRLGPA